MDVGKIFSEPPSTKEEGSIKTDASQLVDNSNKSKVLTTPAVRRIASQFQVGNLNPNFDSI